MNRDNSIQRLVAGALLIAIAIIIPLYSPLRVLLEPASFTLASHVPIFIALFISPGVAVAVAIGSTLGFLLSFPLVVALRAASHLVFVILGSLFLKKFPGVKASPMGIRVFSFGLALVHGISELLVVTGFYFGGTMGAAYYQQGFIQSVLLLVGLGSVVHSMVDFEIALLLVHVLEKQKSFSSLLPKVVQEPDTLVK